MINFLRYGTPQDVISVHYINPEQPFKADLYTKLPQKIIVIRAVAVTAFTGMLALKLAATVFCWPVVIAGVGYAGWTIYSHRNSQDALLEAFYKICGGKDKFEALPTIQLAQPPKYKISSTIDHLAWGELEHPIARSKTLDGRNVIIVKGFSSPIEGKDKTYSVLGFVEQISSYDFTKPHSNVIDLAVSIIWALTFRSDNPFTYHMSRSLYGTVGNSSYFPNSIYSHIPKDMANEFLAQRIWDKEANPLKENDPN